MGKKFQSKRKLCSESAMERVTRLRTRYLHLGKVALYRMSYTRKNILIIAGIRNLSRIIMHKFWVKWMKRVPCGSQYFEDYVQKVARLPAKRVWEAA